MKFSIATTVSASYTSLAELCLPTWHHRAGAEQIDVRYNRGSTVADLPTCWFNNLIQRCEAMQDFVRAAVRIRRPLLLLDVDCLVLKPLQDGFSSSKPIAIARWPTPNMGVIFLNTTLDWPFVDFFDEFADHAVARCKKVMRQPNAFNDAGDQDVMIQMLHAREDDVEKIQCREWNFTYTDRTPPALTAEWRERMRIVHLHFKSWGCTMLRLKALPQQFPEAYPRSYK